MKFKEYLLLEQREYLGQRVGDVLTGIHELLVGGKQIGARQLVKNCDYMVNQIRKILHSTWPRSEYKFLKVLQKVGVALAKAIDEKGDLKEILNSARVELERLGKKLGTPIHKLAAPAQGEAE